MIFLSGHVRETLRAVPNIGFMVTPAMGNRPDLSETWYGVDTGCYANPAAWTLDGYARYLSSLIPYRSTCLFATAPDVFGDGMSTLKAALPVLPIIRALGFPAALVLQPGMTLGDIPWDALDCVFTGGPDWWQRGPHVDAIVQEARRRGVWRHRGRCNSLQRLQASAVAGYDSADGTFAAFGPDVNVPKVLDWMRRLNGQTRLEFAA